MKPILDGVLWAFGLALGLGLISLVFSSYPWFVSAPLGNGELLLLNESEYRDVRTVTRKVPSEHEGMFSYRITGSVVLSDSKKYREAEVYVSLYNKDGIFLGQYSSGPRVNGEQDSLEFSIDVWELYSAEEVVEQKFKVFAK